jgi:putative peptidoglycan lipid II flippase
LYIKRKPSVNAGDKESFLHKTLTRPARTIGFFTLLSRILGFIRDILIARFFGTTLAAEAFVVSFKLPNMFRDLVGEGAMNAAIVPVLSETRTRQGEEAFRKLSTTLFMWFFGILTLLCLAGTLFAPLVVHLAAPGFVSDPEKYQLTVELTRMIFPFVFFVGLSALMMGILHTLGSFGPSAAGPILLNLSMITSLFYLRPTLGIKGLAVGILIGGLLQCLLQKLAFKGRFQLRKNTDFLAPEVKKIFRLLIPRIWGTAVYQVSVLTDTILASFYWIVGQGGQSALYYSSRLFQLPLAIFGVSFAQAALPALSGYFARKDINAFRESISYSLQRVLYWTLPAAMGLAVYSDVIVETLFKRGAFTSYSVSITSDALFFYSWGLMSCAAIKILVSAFYAMQDTKTPVKTASMSLLVNVGLNLILMWHLKIGGLALATSLSATLNAALLYVLLRKRIGSLRTKNFGITLLRALIAGCVMAWGLILLKPWIIDSPYQAAAIGKLILCISGGVIIYYMTSLLLGVRNVSKIS